MPVSEAEIQKRNGISDRWQTRLDRYRKTVKDFDEVVNRSHRITISTHLQNALLTNRQGPHLVYELARHPKQLKAMAHLDLVRTYKALRAFQQQLEKPQP